jgi:hypothetical protein
MNKTTTKKQNFALPSWLADRGWESSPKAPTLRGREAVDAVIAGAATLCLKHDQYGWMLATGTVTSDSSLLWITRTEAYQAAHPHGYALMNALQYIGATPKL